MKKERQPNFLTTNERTNSVDYLLRSYEFIVQTKTNVHAWKWAIIALHGALYGFAICACRGSNNEFVAPARRTKEGKDLKNPRLIGIDDALEACQNPTKMGMFDRSNHLQLSDQQKNSIRRLISAFRNNFEHYIPRTWLIDLAGMANIFVDVLDVIYFLALKTNNFRLTSTQKRKVRSAIFQSKKLLKQSKYFIENASIKRLN